MPALGDREARLPKTFAATRATGVQSAAGAAQVGHHTVCTVESTGTCECAFKCTPCLLSTNLEQVVSLRCPYPRRRCQIASPDCPLRCAVGVPQTVAASCAACQPGHRRLRLQMRRNLHFNVQLWPVRGRDHRLTIVSPAQPSSAHDRQGRSPPVQAARDRHRERRRRTLQPIRPPESLGRVRGRARPLRICSLAVGLRRLVRLVGLIGPSPAQATDPSTKQHSRGYTA